MKRPDKNVEGFVLRHLDLFKFKMPTQREMDHAEARILRQLRSAPKAALLENNSAQDIWRLNRLALVSCVAAVAVALVLLLGIPRGHDASFVVESADGSLSRLSGNQNQVVKRGQRIEAGEVLRTSDPTASILLADGSRVETRARTEFSVESVDDGVRIHLRKGGLIVNAAKQHAGHLYVLTRDVLVSVVGTVFFVNAEEEGSRVAVIEGEVHVQQGATEKKLRPGEQMATSPKMEPIPVKELTWSGQAVEHVAMLEQAQSSRSESPAPAARPKFSAAAVRPVPMNPLVNRTLKCLGVDGLLELGQVGSLGAPVRGYQDSEARRGRCSGPTVKLNQLVSILYGAEGLTRMTGFPASASFPVFYQIEAVADDPEHVTKGELKLMVQSLLEDRFKVRAHLETRDLDGNALTIAKSGIKFKETSVDANAAVATQTPQPSGRQCLDNQRTRGPGYFVRGKCGMKELISVLEKLLINSSFPGPIVDKTGLMGTYNIDFVLEAIPNNLSPTEDGPRGGGGQQSREFTTPIPKALEEQLGLHLERVKVPTAFVVVDHIEQPT